MHGADASAHEPQLEQFSLLTVSSSASTPKPRPQSRGFFLALACPLGAQKRSGPGAMSAQCPDDPKADTWRGGSDQARLMSAIRLTAARTGHRRRAESRQEQNPSADKTPNSSYNCRA